MLNQTLEEEDKREEAHLEIIEDKIEEMIKEISEEEKIEEIT